MIQFILDNKEWLFSGIGVLFITVIFQVFKVLRERKIKAEKVEIPLHPSGSFSAADGAGLIPVPKVNVLNFSEIGNIIKKALPLQRDSVKNSFKGIKVMWDGYLKSATKKYGDIITLRLAPGTELGDRLSTIYCEVSLSDYPELGVMHEGIKIRIGGEIAEVDAMDTVKLINVKLYF